MPRWLSHPALLWPCRLFTAGVFIVAALGKLLDPVKFLGALSEYRLLPQILLPFFAAGIPGVEMVMGLCLALGFKSRAAGGLAAFLLLVFIGALISAIARGMELDCSCFDLLGGSGSTVGWGVVGRDLLLLIPCIPLILEPRKAV